jgi:uncharacterized protein YjiS (DUF1127 family)
VLFHDVQLLFDNLVDDVEIRRAAVLAARRPKAMFLRLECGVSRSGRWGAHGPSTSSSSPAARAAWVALRRLAARRPRPQAARFFLRGRGRLALLALSDRQQLRDAIVEPAISVTSFVFVAITSASQAQRGVLSLHCFDIAEHDATRSQLAIGVDPIDPIDSEAVGTSRDAPP